MKSVATQKRLWEYKRISVFLLSYVKRHPLHFLPFPFKLHTSCLPPSNNNVQFYGHHKSTIESFHIVFVGAEKARKRTSIYVLHVLTEENQRNYSSKRGRAIHPPGNKLRAKTVILPPATVSGTEANHSLHMSLLGIVKQSLHTLFSPHLCESRRVQEESV